MIADFGLKEEEKVSQRHKEVAYYYAINVPTRLVIASRLAIDFK